jgi:palmitoyltransferase ZDHHC3/7/25
VCLCVSVSVCLCVCVYPPQDHHCKWINNCVGHRNYKSFVLMLLWGVVSFSLLFMLFVSRWVLFGVGEPIAIWELVLLAFASVGALLQLLALCFMLGFHVILVTNNITNVEWTCCGGQAPACYWDRGLK